jgi:Domain of unknown function (DUF2024)
MEKSYVIKRDGRTMHFDVVVDADTPHEKAIEYGKEIPFHSGPRRTENDSGRMSILSYTGSATICGECYTAKRLLDPKNGRRSLKLPLFPPINYF